MGLNRSEGEGMGLIYKMEKDIGLNRSDGERHGVK